MLALRCAGVRAASLSRGRAGLRRFLSTARSAAGINVPSCCGHDHDGDDGDDDDAAATVAVDRTGLEYHVRKILEHLGEDPGRSGLVKTPLRVAKSLRFLTQGMHVANPSEALGDAVFAETLSDEMVLVRDIEVHSMCEHHMLPFMGRVHVAYVPNGRVVGLSKLARLTEVFARRLQVQERLTAQIADALMYDAQLAPRGVAVVMECTHMCMVMRGVEKAAATTLTSCMLGEFKDDAALRSELLAMIALPALGTRGSGIGRSGGGGGGRSSHTAARRMQLEEEVGDVRLPTSGLAAPSGVGSAGLSVTPGSGGGGFRGDADDDRVTISLCKQDMKFSAGHFTIFNGGARERLHGHNFAVSAEIVSRHPASSSNSSGGGGSSGAAGGLVLDYKVLKRALRDLCDDWDEVLLLPAASPHLRVEQVQQKLGAGRAAGGGGGDRVRVVFGPGAGRPQLADAEPGSSDVSSSSLAAATAEEEEMVFGASDVVLLPVPNITGEALSQLLLSRFVERVGAGVLAAAGVETVRVGVSSGPGQTVTSSRSLAARLPPGRPGKQPAAASHRAPGPGVVGAAAGRYFSSRAFSSTTAAATTAAVAATTTGAGADAAAGIAVVTGASSGIGRAVAETFAAAGWAVHNISRRPLDAPWAANHLADAADEGALRGAAAEVVDAVAQRAGAGADGARVCVAHCAGVHANDSLQSVADTAGTDELLRTLRINVMAPALLSSLLLPAMGAGSSVVYVGSTLSEIGVAGRLGYTASKHAVVGLMRASVQDLFGSGVHCACVCPGFTDTPMLDQALEVQMGLEGERLREVRATIEGMSSFGRLVRPQEVADLVAFVAENPALNGAVLHANLGQRQS